MKRKPNLPLESSKLGDILPEIRGQIAKAGSRLAGTTGLSTGLCDLDDLLDGLRPGQLIVVAGRPGMGKTSLLLKFIDHIGGDLKKPVVLFSSALDAQEIVRTMLCCRARVSQHDLWCRKIDESGIKKLLAAADAFDDAPIWIDDEPCRSVREMELRIKRMKVKGGLRALMIDDVEMVAAEGWGVSGGSPAMETACCRLKLLARELQIPVVVTVGVDRSIEFRDEHRPLISDIRHTEAFEVSADVVMILYRDFVYTPETPHKDFCEVIMAKNRNGRTNAVTLRFNSEFMRFEDVTEEPPRREPAQGESEKA